MAQKKDTPQTDAEPIEAVEEAVEVLDAPVEEAVEVETSDAGAPEAEGDVDAEADAAGEDEAADVAPDQPESQPEKKSSGFVPLVLGGVIAAGLGYAVPTFLMNDGGVDPALDARLAQIEAQTQTDAFDPAPLQQALEAQAADLAALRTQVEALEARPVATSDGGAVPADLARRLTSQAQEIAALRSQLDQITDAQVQAVALAESDAMAQAEARARDAARDQLRLAMTSGAPFADALSILGGDVPSELAAVAEGGVPTQEALQDSFPDLARVALAEAVKAQAAESGSTATRLGAFLRSQVGARSLEPREGDDPDAVLSRAEAAVRADDFASAVQELDALPEAGRAELVDWLAQAQTRAQAQAALTAYLDVN